MSTLGITRKSYKEIGFYEEVVANTEDVNEYVSEKKWDIPIAIDDENEGIFSIVNGSDALPQTIVLNKKGEVIYNQVGSVSAEIIANLYQQAK